MFFSFFHQRKIVNIGFNNLKELSTFEKLSNILEMFVKMLKIFYLTYSYLFQK